MSETDKISQGTAALPTSIDVARRAGVSQAAVSLVFGGKAEGRVGGRTQEAILRAAEELGYRPNRVARTLRSGRSRLVIFAVPDVSNPYFAAVLQGAEQAARKHDYAILLAGVRDEQDWQHTVLDALTSHVVDGCLLYTELPGMAQTSTLLRGKAVLVDRSHSVLPTLQLDIQAGVRVAMKHLFALGHTRIAHLRAAIELETFQLRHVAYRAAMQAAGLAIPDAYEERAAFLLEDACAAAYRLLTRVEAPSAVLCDSDMLAVGVYKAAHKLGRRIPEDLSVVGFDDSLVASILEPELTTVAIPTTRIGEEAFLLLRSLLEGRPVPTPVLMPLELVIRASTAVIVRQPETRKGTTSDALFSD
jgi:LacI family transcriptional regulator, repressor for deo operon, udp, cdd, tsx, nupC, and nupG